MFNRNAQQMQQSSLTENDQIQENVTGNQEPIT